MEPLGITLGLAQDVRCYSPVSHPPRAASPPFTPGGSQPELSPVAGLVLTAQGAAKLLEALVPAAAGTGAPASPAGSSSTPRGGGGAETERQKGSVLSCSLLQQMCSVHFVDPAKVRAA
jgi:hypothetical protein